MYVYVCDIIYVEREGERERESLSVLFCLPIVCLSVSHPAAAASHAFVRCLFMCVQTVPLL